MKCFIHFSEEAIAACRTCGKGMCASCSAYSEHSGVCPECRKKEFEKEVASLKAQIKEGKWNRFWSAFGTIALCWTVVFGIVFGVKWYKNHATLTKNQERKTYLEKEIEKLNAALSNRSLNATI